MIGEVLLYIGSIVIVVWGIGHIVPTKSVVKGFGEIPENNRRIITMEWIAEGLTLCFLGVIVLVVALLGGSQNPVSTAVYWLSGAMLLVMASLTASTGARTKIVPIKVCPIIKTIVAILFFLGSIL